MTTNNIVYNLADCPPGIVAIPAQDWMWTESANAFLHLTQGLPPYSYIRFGRWSSSPAWNRNNLTEQFLADDSLQWILFVDADMTPPPATVARLLSHNVDAVGAFYFSRREPFAPEFARDPADADWQNRGELRPVTWVGAGCILVRRSVFEKLSYPWWEHPNPGEGEDILFSKKLRALGIPVYVDLGLPIGHMAARAITEMEVQAYLATEEGQLAWVESTQGSSLYRQLAEQRTTNALSNAVLPRA